MCYSGRDTTQDAGAEADAEETEETEGEALMGICWYCHWGWPKQVRDIYDVAVAELDGDESPLESGPSHIVWCDENFDDDCIRICLEKCGKPDCDDLILYEWELEIVRKSLEKLLAVPEAIRCCEPEDYDDNNPQNYPPPAGLGMVRK